MIVKTHNIFKELSTTCFKTVFCLLSKSECLESHFATIKMLGIFLFKKSNPQCNS